MTQVHKFNNAITILLPVLNAAKTLRSAINSIRQQSFQNWELLVLDDASTDDSLRIVLLKIKGSAVLQGQTSGLAARLNQGIDLAQGEITSHVWMPTTSLFRIDWLAGR